MNILLKWQKARSDTKHSMGAKAQMGFWDRHRNLSSMRWCG